MAHQARKRDTLIQLMQERHSERMFDDDRPVDMDLLQDILDTRLSCASSCNRHAIEPSVVLDRDQKALLGGVLVGGVGWVHRAPVVVLLWADPLAYKAGDEIKWMPYLDAGIVIHQYYLSATAVGLKCCYVNPNIRKFNRQHFMDVFSVLFGDGEDPVPGIFCGAMAIGWGRDS